MRRKKSSRGKALPKDQGGGRVSVPLSLSNGLEEKITTTADKLDLPKSVTMRLALDRGLDILLQQLTGKTSPEQTSQAATVAA